MEKMLTVAEVAGILRVSVRTVYNLLEAGTLRGVRVGRAWRVPESALEALTAQGPGEPGPVAVAGAWYVNAMANRIVVELPGGELKHFAVVPFRAATLEEMEDYKGYHPAQMTGGAQTVPDYVLRHYGLSLATVSLPVIVVEAGDRSIHPVEKLTLELSGDRQAMLSQAMTAVAARGYRVLRDAEGGCCEYMPRAAEDGGDHIVITVWPEEDRGHE